MYVYIDINCNICIFVENSNPIITTNGIKWKVSLSRLYLATSMPQRWLVNTFSSIQKKKKCSAHISTYYLKMSKVLLNNIPCKYPFSIGICISLLNGYLILPYGGTIFLSMTLINRYLDCFLLMAINILLLWYVFVNIRRSRIPRSRIVQ